ncbi:MAG TPA: ribosome rescue GTPase HflX [Verrucomicrobiae bacterium]|nr:ribosome rescue GTPase HflX [Verrucomicrobiae bacterium]
MFERPPPGEKAVLVHLAFPKTDYEADRREFIDLARSAGAEVKAIIGGRRQRPDASLYIGSGKADEIGAAAREGGAELAVFNHDLSPSQERNLEKRIQARVLDRTGLILHIFAQRARSHEGKLQVELAQLQHHATRLVRGWTHLERQRGGGIGMTGPGETQLELDRRLIGKRIKTLEGRLDLVRRRREQNRRARTKSQMATVSLVGYTNAGKSTLFNALTGARTYASSQLFATLDPTLRRIDLPDSRAAVLADTVGFVRDLPHDLVAAFRATLEEARESHLLLHVIDAADPERSQRIEQVEAVLAEIGAESVPRLEVYNKIDLRPDEAPRIERDEGGAPWRAHVSSLSGAGLDLLRAAIAERIGPLSEVHTLTLPPAAARLRARLFAEGAVREETVGDDGAYRLRVSMPAESLRRALREAGLEPRAVGL